MVDDIKPNAFSNDTKTQWINECEGLVQTEVMLISPDECVRYDYQQNSNDELLAKAPHDKIYYVYLCAMIDFALGEYSKYQNTMQLFNAHFGEYMRFFAKNYHPADGECVNCGYYLSAYGLAKLGGFSGTQEEWIASLKGEKGDKGDTGDTGNGIDGVSINSDYHLILHYTNGNSVDCGYCRGPMGIGDMQKSIYDPQNAVVNAGGIAPYVSGAIAGKADSSQLGALAYQNTVSQTPFSDSPLPRLRNVSFYEGEMPDVEDIQPGELVAVYE